MAQPAHKRETHRFLFKGGAVGFGGLIWEPSGVSFSSAACALLSSAGGHASMASGAQTILAEGFDEAHSPFVISYREARSEARGEWLANRAKTKTTVTTAVQGIQVVSQDPERDLRHVVEIDSISVTMESRHDLNPGEQTRIKVIRPTVEGLRIDGNPVGVTFASQLVAKSTYKDMKKAYEDDDKFRKNHEKLFWKPPGHRPDKLPAKFGIAHCTIVKRLTGLPAGVAVSGMDEDDNPLPHAIWIPGFGTMFLGELTLMAYERRLTLLRFKLGCPTEGITTFGDIIIDSHGWPP